MLKAGWRRRWGLTAAQAEQKWQELLALEAYRWSLEQRHLSEAEIDALVIVRREEVIRGRPR